MALPQQGLLALLHNPLLVLLALVVQRVMMG
jgi:hypothetical protein